MSALVESARAAIESGEFSAAQSYAEELIGHRPGAPDGHILKAQALERQGRVTDALETLRAALKANPRDPVLLRFTRNLAFAHAGIERAGEFALALSEVTPGDLKNELYVIDWYLASEQIEAALDRAEFLTKAFPGSAQASMRKARALVGKDSGDQALVILRDAVSVSADNEKLLTLAREVAFREGEVREAKDYAERLAGIAPNDRKNRNFLVQTCLAAGEFSEALAHATALLEDTPDDRRALLLKAQALVALHRVRMALELLRHALEAHPNDIRLLRLARSVAFQNGRFKEAADYSARVIRIDPNDVRNQVFLVQSYMAGGRFDEVEAFFESDSTNIRGVLKEEQRYFHGFKRLIDTTPVLASAWKLALSNGVESVPAPVHDRPLRELGATMIQYWSQGSPPDDVQIVSDNWKTLLETERLGRVELFDRKSALGWIEDNAPEFVGQFSAAFHYAMESDIFRLAYASRRPCIYMDIDSWPLEHSAAILRFAIEKSATMLYLRAHRPTILNGFFVSTPESPFFRRLIDECLAIDLGSMPKNYLTLEATFGPTRYGKVFGDFVQSSRNASASIVSEVPGCSVVSLEGSEVYFAHEAAVASVRPPFPLGYKATDGYWKYMSLEDE